MSLECQQDIIAAALEGLDQYLSPTAPAHNQFTVEQVDSMCIDLASTISRAQSIPSSCPFLVGRSDWGNPYGKREYPSSASLPSPKIN